MRYGIVQRTTPNFTPACSYHERRHNIDDVRYLPSRRTYIQSFNRSLGYTWLRVRIVMSAPD